MSVEIPESPPEGDPRDSFQVLTRSLRRWVLGLGLLVLAGLLALGAGRPVLAGYCVGWFLSLFSLDHLAARALSIEQRQLGSSDAKVFAARTFLLRYLVLIVVIVLASRVGASPVAAVSGLLLLQAAIVCRSIMIFLTDERLASSCESAN